MKKAVQVKQEYDTLQQTISPAEKDSLRINKYLTACGYCSRREADRLVEQQRVTIDGVPAAIGTKVLHGQTVLVDGQAVAAPANHVYIALHKPIGITCTLEGDKDGNIGDFMNHKQRIFPIGRLDKDSSGLLLLTSDGDIVNKILRAENNHDKEYIVKVSAPLTSDFLQKIAAGVEITNMRTKTRVTTKPCTVQRTGHTSFSIVLTQGLNRQIRRMCNELGYQIYTLRRVRIMNIQLGELQPGQWRYLSPEELATLRENL